MIKKIIVFILDTQPGYRVALLHHRIHFIRHFSLIGCCQNGRKYMVIQFKLSTILFISDPKWSIILPSDADSPHIPSTFLVPPANSSKRPSRYPSSLSPKRAHFLSPAKQANRVRSFQLSTGMVGITLSPFFCLRRRWTATSTCGRNMREEWHRHSWKSRIL